MPAQNQEFINQRLFNDAVHAQAKQALMERRARLGAYMREFGYTQVKATGAPGGALGKIAHKASYDEIGIAFTMFFEMLIFALSMMLNATLNKDTKVFDNLPDSLKIDKDSYDPARTPIYKSYQFDGKVYLDYSHLLNADELNDIDVLANGYMLKPNADFSLRKEFARFNVNMTGSAWDNELEGVLNDIMVKRSRPMTNQFDSFRRQGPSRSQDTVLDHDLAVNRPGR